MNTQIFNSPGELFLGSDPATASALGPRYFRSAAKAVRFAVEQAAPVSLRGARLLVGNKMLGPNQIQAMHQRLVHLGQALPARQTVSKG